MFGEISFNLLRMKKRILRGGVWNSFVFLISLIFIPRISGESLYELCLQKFDFEILQRKKIEIFFPK